MTASPPNPPSAPRGRVRSPQDLAAGLFLIVVGVIAWWLGRDLTAGTLGAMGPGMAPKALAVMVGVLGAGLTISALVSDGERLERWHLRGPVFILGAVVLFGATIRGLTLPGGLTIPPLGLVVAGPLCMIVGSFASDEARLKETILFAVAMTAFCIVLFKVALGLPIPVAPWLIGQ